MLDLHKSDVTLITIYQVNNYEKNVVWGLANIE